MAEAEEILSGLDEQQRAVATSLHGPVVVLAGAGTGKTRAITHRVAYAVAMGAHDARRTMAVTFTNRAAGEMRGRLAELGVEGASVRTFHSAALRQLRFFWPRFASGEPPQLVTSKYRLISEAAAVAGCTVNASLVRDLATDIEWAKGHEIDSSEVPDHPRTLTEEWAIDAGSFAAVYRAYDELKADRHLMDFEDLLLITLGALRTRPDVLDEVQSAYRWFTVDEFQDVSPLQHQLLVAWRGDREDVCAVGDVSQTIYSFTGATSDFLSGFTREFPDATVVRLANCYRCSPEVVAAANAIAADLEDQPHVVRLRSMCPPGPRPDVWIATDEQAEAAAVATRIASLIAESIPPSQIAVLFRMNAQSAVLESALAERGIAVAVRGTERFFDRPEVREATTRIRGAAMSGDADDVAEGATRLGEQVRAVLSSMGWTSQAPQGVGAVRDRWESLAALVALADTIGGGAESIGLSAFVTELDRRAAAQHAPVTSAVTLSSLHSAKGLEWDVVFIVGCSEGLLPVNSATSQAQIEEERRLLYVGVTRARRALSVSWSRARQPGGAGERRPSRFLAAFTAVGSNPHADAAPGGERVGVLQTGPGRIRRDRQRRAPAACRVCGKALVTGSERTIGRCRTCPGREDPELRERLRAWRLDQAHERGVPAFVVCTDATLDALIERSPTTLEELADVPGIGPRKIADYGPALLSLLATAEPADP